MNTLGGKNLPLSPGGEMIYGNWQPRQLFPNLDDWGGLGGILGGGVGLNM